MRIAPDSAQERITARFIPQGATEQRYDDANAVVYSFERAGRWCALGYAGTAYRPAFHFTFRSAERREQYIADWLKSQRATVASREARAAQRKAAAARGHDLQVGDVLYSSWGYEQTNIDFYQVVRVVSLRSVELRELTQQVTETGNMCGTATAVKDSFRAGAPALIKRADGCSVPRLGGCRRAATKWNGHPLYCSWYA